MPSRSHAGTRPGDGQPGGSAAPGAGDPDDADVAGDAAGDAGAADDAVTCDGLVVRYGRVTAVDGLSLSARRGQVLAVLGPNGAGKTSTVETLEGYRRATGGRVRVLGLDPVADHRALVGRMGVMLQRGGVYPTMAPRQALHLFARYYDRPRDPDALLDLVALGPVATTPWRRLSGGEQQRLSLALALVGRPEVLFLDEPTAGVDPEGRLAIRQVVADERSRGTCVVLTTHELPEAEHLADHVVIVARGRVVASGTPAQLAASAGGEAVRFVAPAGLDVTELAAALGPAAGGVAEAAPGHYEVAGPATPATVAAVAAWLDRQGLPVQGLRTSAATLEEAYLQLVGATDGQRGGGSDGGGSDDGAGNGAATGASRAGASQAGASQAGHGRRDRGGRRRGRR